MERIKTDLAFFASPPLPIEEALRWTQPLLMNGLGAVPIFHVEDLDSFALTLRMYECKNIVISHPRLIKEWTGQSIEGVAYSIYSFHFRGMEIQALLLPDINDLEWDRLELALDRFEEVL